MTQFPTFVSTQSAPTQDAPYQRREPGHTAPHRHSHDHHHSHHHGHGSHSHAHGVIDPEIASSERGLWAVKWSLVGLLVTGVIQIGVFWLSGSVALLADVIHNFGNALTALPLGVAFLISRRKPTPRFSYGFARLEDLTGVMIVVIVLISAIVTAYESVARFYHPQPLTQLGALAIAALVGFVGNELVALFRIRVGREIQSTALIVDGYHALADGLVSLAVLLSALGVSLGYAWADPVIGLVITVVLLKIVWESGVTIFSRLLDGVEPDVLAAIHQAIAALAEQIPMVTTEAIANLRTRWLGHCLHVALDLHLEPSLSLEATQTIIEAVERQLKADLPYLGLIVVRGIPTPPSKGMEMPESVVSQPSS